MTQDGSNIGLCVETRWKPPEANVLNINFDASFDTSHHKSGSRLIVRDHSSTVLASKVVMHRSVKIRVSSRFREIIIEGDSLNVIRKSKLETIDKSKICPHI